MRAFVLDGVKRPTDIEERDIRALQHDTGGLPGRKRVGANGFHLGILGVGGRWSGKAPPVVANPSGRNVRGLAANPDSRDEAVAVAGRADP